jgi:hypothetical protein
MSSSVKFDLVRFLLAGVWFIIKIQLKYCGVHIGARPLLYINVIWFGYIARLSQ